MSLVRRALEARGANPSLPWGDSTPPPPGWVGPIVAGVPVSEQTAMSIMTVYTCVGILSDAVSTLNFQACTEGSDGSVTPVAKQPLVLSNPSSEFDAQETHSMEMVSLTLRGNSYSQVVSRDPMGFPTQLFQLHPDQVRVKRDIAGDGRIHYWVKGVEVNPDDIFHIRGLMQPGSVEGYNPIHYARLGFGMAMASDQFAAAFFANSAMPGGVIQVPGSLNRQQTRAMARAWIQAHQGSNKAQLPAVLTGGAEWKPVTIAPDDAQFLQTRQSNQHDIGMFYRIPEHMLAMQDRTSSWGSGIEQMSIGFVRYTLRIWIIRLQNAYSRILPRSLVARANLHDLLAGDTLQRYQGYLLGRTGGWLTINDILKLEKMAPRLDEWSDNPMAPLNSAQNGTVALNVGIPPSTAPQGGGGQGAPGGGGQPNNPDNSTS